MKGEWTFLKKFVLGSSRGILAKESETGEGSKQTERWREEVGELKVEA